MTELERRLKAVLDDHLDSWPDEETEKIAGELAAAVGAATTTEMFGLRNPRTNEVAEFHTPILASQAAGEEGGYFDKWELVSCFYVSGRTPWEPIQ